MKQTYDTGDTKEIFQCVLVVRIKNSSFLTWKAPVPVSRFQKERARDHPFLPPTVPQVSHTRAHSGKSLGSPALGAAEGQSPASVHCFCSFECQEGTSAGEGKHGISPSNTGIRDKHKPAVRWGYRRSWGGGGEKKCSPSFHSCQRS